MKINEALLTELLQKRKREAEERQIYSKAKSIALKLGERQPKRHGYHWRFSRGRLIIYYDDMGGLLTVSFGDVEVYKETRGTLYAFRPDIPDWMELIDEIYYGEVVPLIEEEKRRELEKRLRELEKKWGFKPEELLIKEEMAK